MQKWFIWIVSALFLAAPTGFSNEAHAQSSAPEQACLEYVKGGNLAWNREGASQWHEPNAQRLCAGAPISDYPTQCFKAAIDIGLNWQQGIQLCRYNFNSCVYQAMTKKGMRIGSNSKVSSGNGNFLHEVYQCHYGQPHPGIKEVEQQVALIQTKCTSEAAKVGSLNQTEIANLCGDWDAGVHATEPVRCYKRMIDFELKGQKPLALQLCNKTVKYSLTYECYNEGKATGYDDNTIITVCGIDDRYYEQFYEQIVENNQTYGAVIGMPDTCIRRNAITNQGKTDIAGAWAKCKGQPLY